MKRAIAALLLFLLAVPSGWSQQQHVYSQAELDQVLAPVALYPDPLLSQILMAATYPAEVAEAANWTQANPGLQGDAAVLAVQNQDWDPSVKSLVAFPQVLQRMAENPGWAQSLGDAFLAQQPQVMDTVQELRQRAQAAGNLQSSDQLIVQQQGPQIYIEPANPQVVYVPYYDPYVVYGPWWWPAYRPVAWAPWPGYVRIARPGVSVSFWWGAPIAVSGGFFFGAFDWPRHAVRVVNAHPYYYRPPVIVNRTVVVNREHWTHDPYHRRGVQYRDPQVRQQFATQAQSPSPAPERAAVPERRAIPERQQAVTPERREHRYQRAPGRDSQDSKVLSPQSARPQRMPPPTAQPTRQPQVLPQVQVQARPQPLPQAQARPQPQARPHGPQQEERWRGHEKGRERG